MEDGCVEFSNIHGLSRIGFPKGNLEPVFEQIRQVLEREDVLQTPLLKSPKEREEPEDPLLLEGAREEDWRQSAPLTLQTAKALLNRFQPELKNLRLRYNKTWLSLAVGQYVVLRIFSQAGGGSRAETWFSGENLNAATSLLKTLGVRYATNEETLKLFGLDKQTIEPNGTQFGEFARLIKQQQTAWGDLLDS